MDKLKPCPFCGGEANYQGFELNNYCVYCRKCGTSTRKYYASKDEARDAWNRRANDGKAPAEDAVAVVRCKDCMYWNDGSSLCTCNFDIMSGENFCSFGERRSDNAAD